jgi:hypothetical protein
LQPFVKIPANNGWRFFVLLLELFVEMRRNHECK